MCRVYYAPRNTARGVSVETAEVCVCEAYRSSGASTDGMARWTASAEWAAGPALDGRHDMPLRLSLSKGLGLRRIAKGAQYRVDACLIAWPLGFEQLDDVLVDAQ